MHRFYMLHSFRTFHRNVMAPCFLFLSAKVEEQPRKLEHVLKVAHLCLNKDEAPLDPKSNEYMQLSQDLINNESVILQTLGFELSVEHPHTYVVKCAQLVKASKDLAQTSYFLATNSLHLTTFSIQYKPTVVACICIYVSCKWANWEILETTDKKSWWEYIDNTVTPELLEDLSSYFIKILDNSQTRLKKKITSGPLVYKGGILQQKRHKEDGRVDETARKHHNGTVEAQRGFSSSHSKMQKMSDGTGATDDRGMSQMSRASHGSVLGKSQGPDSKDSRKDIDISSGPSSKHVDHSSNQQKRTVDSAKASRYGNANTKSELNESRFDFNSQIGDGASTLLEGSTDRSSGHHMKGSSDNNQRQPHLNRISDSSSKIFLSSGSHGVSTSQKHSFPTDTHSRHSSPMKKPRIDAEQSHHSVAAEQAAVSESHVTKLSRSKHEQDTRKVSNHELHKHRHIKSSSHHKVDHKLSSSDIEKLKQAQHASFRKMSSSHKHSHSSKEDSSTSHRTSSNSSKHGSHSGISSSHKNLSHPSTKSPSTQKVISKKTKLEPSDSLLPPPPPPPSFPNAILNPASTGKTDLAYSHVGHLLPGSGLSQSANPNSMVHMDSAANQYRDFFMAGLPDIPLTDLLPSLPPASLSSSGGVPASPPPPPPPPRS